MKSFFAGFADFLAGFRLVLAVPSIRKWALIPMALNTLLLGVMVVLVFLYADNATRAVIGEAHSSMGKVAWWLAWVALLLLGLLASVGLMLVLSSVVAAPFYTKLSEATLVHLTGKPVQSPSGSLLKIALVSIWQELVKLCVFIGVQSLVFGIGFIPLVGPVVAVLMTFMILAFEFVDYALEARGIGVARRYRFVVAHTPRCAGFGAAAFLVTMVPLLMIVAAPAAVAGAARLVLSEWGASDEAFPEPADLKRKPTA